MHQAFLLSGRQDVNDQRFLLVAVESLLLVLILLVGDQAVFSHLIEPLQLVGHKFVSFFGLVVCWRHVFL